MKPFPRFMIAAAHKSSGKTVVSTGLAAAFSRAGDDIGCFKKGPDYIDPMWLGQASGRPCYNLDFNAQSRDEIAPFFASRARGLSLVEANKGLFDGLSDDGSDANAALARMLDLPVVLVIDTQGMTRGIAPLLRGYLGFEEGVNIAGVILNKVGGTRHEEKLRRAVEGHTDLPVLGAIGKSPKLDIGERHLGLTTPAETGALERLIAGFADLIEDSVDLAALRALAGAAPPMAPVPKPATSDVGQGLRIGVARDTAFGFYYPDDLEAFGQAGAEIVPINMMYDTELPEIDGLFIGGGFPEMRMEALEANTKMRAQLRTALDNGLPCYAECGGLMYLCERLDDHGESRQMVGAIPGRAVMHKRPQGRGYVAFEPTPNHPWPPAGGLKGHEFHYASVEDLPGDVSYARTMTRGFGTSGRGDGIVQGNILAGFCHLRSTGGVDWVPRFLKFVRRVKSGGNEKGPADPAGPRS